MDKLTRYKTIDYKLPDTNLAWRMYEAGVENFGKTGKPDALPLVKPGSDEVLVRVDAIGICMSDVKLITQGSAHARITGRNLVAEPVIAGHEVSLTVVEAGENYKNKYKPGDRFIVQADVYYKGVNIAYGYALAGGMQQLGIVGEAVLNGDEGSYLIPVKPETGYAEAALVEPWTCVVASYRIKPRKALKPGGVTLIVGVEPGDYELDAALCADGPPEKVLISGIGDEVKLGVCNSGCCQSNAVQIGPLTANAVKALSDERTGGKGFDDVIILGTPDPDLAEALSANLAKQAVMAIVAKRPIARPLQIDVGRVHYDYIDYTGTTSGKISDAYTSSRDSALTAGGTAWFVGGAGPMGQMHVQRACMMKDGPRKMLVTDVDNTRIEHLKAGVAEAVKKNGIEIVFVNPVEDGQEAVDRAIAQLTGGQGFDDILMTVVPAVVPALVEAAMPHLAQGGLINIFTGVPRGTIATMDLSAVYMKGNRLVGSSGSRPQDMVDTLAYTEAGELPTISSLAAIGGIDAMAEGVRGVKEAWFPGKTVIFPHIQLPLTALTDLKNILPEVYAKLKDGKFWTKEAEEALLEGILEI